MFPPVQFIQVHGRLIVKASGWTVELAELSKGKPMAAEMRQRDRAFARLFSEKKETWD